MQDELFFAKTSEEGNHHLSVARATSDIKSSPLSTSAATEAEHLVLQAGDIVFVFQKRDDVWWVEHKKYEPRKQPAIADVSLTNWRNH